MKFDRSDFAKLGCGAEIAIAIGVMIAIGGFASGEIIGGIVGIAIVAIVLYWGNNH